MKAATNYASAPDPGPGLATQTPRSACCDWPVGPTSPPATRSRPWLNRVEVWFGIIERQAIHRGTFRSVRELNATVRAFING